MRNHQKLLRRTALAVLAALTLALAGCSAPQSAAPDSGSPAGTTPLAADSSADGSASSAPESAPQSEADSGGEDGALFTDDSLALIGEPNAILPLSDGTVLITDKYHRVVWQLSEDTLTLYAGAVTQATDVRDRPLGGYFDSVDIDSLFALPWAIAPFLDGYAVSDAENNVLRLIQNGQVRTLNATGSRAAFNYPTGLAAGEDGCLYVSDTRNGRVRRITPEGRITTVAEGLSDPMGLSWYDGVLYIAETGANRILQLSGGKLTVLAGQGGEGYEDGKAAKALFCAPQGVLAAEGCVYVADTANGAVRRVRDGVVDTLISRDLSSQDALLPVSPTGLCLRENELYICDSFSGALLKLPAEE